MYKCAESTSDVYISLKRAEILATIRTLWAQCLLFTNEQWVLIRVQVETHFSIIYFVNILIFFACIMTCVDTNDDE